MHICAFAFKAMSLCALLLLSGELFSQKIYLHGGASLSTIRTGQTGVSLNKLNAMGGVGVDLGDAKSEFSAIAEVNFVQKGGRSVNPQPGFAIEQTLNDLFYVQAALLPTYRFDEHWSAFLGPAFGVKVYSAESNWFGPDGTASDFRDTELSMIGGVRYNFSENFGAMLRLEHSVLNVIRIDPQLQGLRGANSFHALAGASLFYGF